MTKKYLLPYGKKSILISLEEDLSQELYLPKEIHPDSDDFFEVIAKAIRNPLNKYTLPANLSRKTRVAISVNDKTRPVPNHLLFPPLLTELSNRGVVDSNITILIATGTHLPMSQEEFTKILPEEIVNRYRVVSHDCDEQSNLVYKGKTSGGSEVFVNQLFDLADLKIVVGDIEPHHFAGFSGGVKSAAIGLTGRKTINHNHALLQNPNSSVGRYEDNPLRQDIEEIGALIGVDCALNAVLNEKKEILRVFFGRPLEVMKEGIRFIRVNGLTEIKELYDLVIASAGGFPKDINLYQAQKALTHASMFCRPEGTVLLIAECSEGVGSQGHLDFMKGKANLAEAKRVFLESDFKVGPHKSLQFALIAERINFRLKSEILRSEIDQLCIPRIQNLDLEIEEIIRSFGKAPKVAILPYATATIPHYSGG